MNAPDPIVATDPCTVTPAAELTIVVRCHAGRLNRVRYVFDSLMAAAGIPVAFADVAPARGPWLEYAPAASAAPQAAARLFIPHCQAAWDIFDARIDVSTAESVDGVPVVLPQRSPHATPDCDMSFDLIANAFYFLSSWSERIRSKTEATRQLFPASVFARLGIPQDIVDRYLDLLLQGLTRLCERTGTAPWPRPNWSGDAGFAVVLSHDVDFVPCRPGDNLRQAFKTVARHLVRHRDPADAWRAARGWLRAWREGRDPYGCLPEMLERETTLGVRASYQVAVGHRHPGDVNYRIEDDSVRNYLRCITDAGFELCLHGSYRSTEVTQWYVDEAELLARRLSRPIGSRQHFLSFDYDALFTAQEQAGIEFDMSMGYPDRPGPRAGFSHPYYPYNLQEDRPYRVLEISLFLMDVTLRGYMNLRPDAAWPLIAECVASLRAKGACASVVWHPIVFGDARDPGYGRLFYSMVEHIVAAGGLATDGRTVNRLWRERTASYASFSAT
jgi:hypothetical protein